MSDGDSGYPCAYCAKKPAFNFSGVPICAECMAKIFEPVPKMQCQED